MDSPGPATLPRSKYEPGPPLPCNLQQLWPGHEAEEGGRERGRASVTAQTPCPQPDLPLQSWGSSEVCLETEVCSRPVLFTPVPLLPGSGVPKQKGSLRLLLRATCASLVCSSHLVTTALPQVQQTIVCTLVFKPPTIPGPTGAPTQGEPSGNRRAKSPSSASALLGSRTWNKMGARQRAGRSRQAGAGEACAPDHSLWQDRGWLSLFVSLSTVSVSLSFSCLSVTVSHATAPAAWKPQVSGRPGFSPVV